VRLTAAEIAAATAGEVVAGDPATPFAWFTNDSRNLGTGVEPAACFVALRDHRDGHDFVDLAFAAGAAGAIVREVPEGLVHANGRAIVRVADPAQALIALATAARNRLEHLRVVAITGSTGKTSTKDLTAAAVGAGLVVHANPESFNNEIGLPLTVLGADDLTEVLVTEMGARFAGNIARLCAIARPSIGVVTNIGLAHAEHLGGPDGVLAVKGELLEALPASGLAVVDGDDGVTPKLVGRTRAPVLRCGSGPGVDVRLTRCRLDDQLRASIVAKTPWGTVTTRLGVRGEHQATNALFAIAVAGSLGVAPDVVAAGLAAATGSRWRLELERRPDGVMILNDVYNANPTSMAAALHALAALPVTGRRIAVLGEMRELGAHAVDAHTAVGELAGRLRVDVVVGVGEGGAAITAAAGAVPTRLDVADAAAALTAVVTLVQPGDGVLLKASRAVGLELVAGGLLGYEPPSTASSA
jgi:UDP-N-acetylmuramoyl-tripeptide--D-alanyl-D-alanine ligase